MHGSDARESLAPRAEPEGGRTRVHVVLHDRALLAAGVHARECVEPATRCDEVILWRGPTPLIPWAYSSKLREFPTRSSVMCVTSIVVSVVDPAARARSWALCSFTRALVLVNALLLLGEADQAACESSPADNRAVVGFDEQLHVTLQLPAAKRAQDLAEASGSPPQRLSPLPELGADGTLLCFVPINRTMETDVLLGKYSGEQNVMLGTWHTATPDSDAAAVALAKQLTLVRKDAVAAGIWQPQTCVNAAQGYFRKRMFVTNGQHQKSFIARGPSSVEAQARCVRDCGFGVFDTSLPEVVTRDVMALLGANSAALRARAPGTVSSAEVYSPKTLDGTIAALLSLPVVALLAEKTNIDPAALEVSVARLDMGLRASSMCEMHSDFHSSTSFVFTAIIYLSDWGDRFTGGETVFAHEIGGGEKKMGVAVRTDDSATVAIAMTGGYIVQPKIGRVVMFTGGSENLHCKMPSKAVKLSGAAQEETSSPRTVMQLWIRCSTDAKMRHDESRRTAAELASNSEMVARARAWLESSSREERERAVKKGDDTHTTQRATDRALP